MHPFDCAIALEPLPEGRFRGATSPAYANMVGPFGGVTAACLLNAPLLHPDRIGEPVALTVNFAAPLSDGAFEIAARPVRTNRSTQHWTIELEQGGEVAATGTAVFAARRPTWSASEASPPLAPVAPPESLPPSGPRGRLAWTERYDMRFVRGAPPEAFDEVPQADSVSHVWLRDEPPRPLDFPALASLCDSFFPRVIMRRRRFVPIGTVSLTTYFHADAALLAAHGACHVLGAVRAVNFRNGYFDQNAELWSADGELLASSHQVVYYRD